MTNFDRLKNMTIEEMVKFIFNILKISDAYYRAGNCTDCEMCYQICLNWLKKGVDDERENW